MLEGICFSLRNRIDWLEKLSGSSIDRLRVEGGVVRSSVWLQLKADITGREVEAVQLEEPTALGAALLAGVAIGAYSSHSAAALAPAESIRRIAPGYRTSSPIRRCLQRRLPEIARAHRRLRCSDG